MNNKLSAQIDINITEFSLFSRVIFKFQVEKITEVLFQFISIVIGKIEIPDHHHWHTHVSLQVQVSRSLYCNGQLIKNSVKSLKGTRVHCYTICTGFSWKLMNRLKSNNVYESSTLHPSLGYRQKIST